MNGDLLIGLLVIVAALVAIALLTLWSRWSIDRIARDGFASAREILVRRSHRRGR